MGDWRRMGHEQRRRIGAPSATLNAMPPLASGYDSGLEAQMDARVAATALGHRIGGWEAYGRKNAKARCTNCGAEVRVPYSTTRAGYLRPAGDAINPAVRTCQEIAYRHPNRKRGTL